MDWELKESGGGTIYSWNGVVTKYPKVAPSRGQEWPVILFVLGVFMSPWFIIPAVVVVGFFLLSGPLSAMLKASRDPSGTPSTGEASYEPVARPEERTV